MANRILRRLFVLVVATLAVSGLAQMPIFKRYYVADVPGLGWLAEFYLTHKLHYVAAALLLAILAWVITAWVLRASRTRRLTTGGWIKVALLAGIVLTGVIRMYKNQPGVSFSPELTLVVDWAHLGLAMLLGLVALAARFLRKGAWTVRSG